MLFNSLKFLLFFPTVFTIFWSIDYFFMEKKIIPKLTKYGLFFQNLFLLVASYLFYAIWDVRFLLLIIFSSLVDYLVGIGLGNEKNQTKRKVLLGISLSVNLGLLGVLKYFNFFIESFVDFSNILGFQANISSLNLILPVGISFYTFQTLSYSIDVYKRQLNPTKNILSFFTYVAFFPQLVAGPIERASHLLPQFFKRKKFNYGLAVSGMRQIVWGFFKKVVIADSCSTIVNDIFLNYSEASSGLLILGAILFAFQIYGDFSGYSDIAIGISRLIGFDLMQNFAFPYFSRDIAEFWRRWHISLSSWFRDYLYIPLGGSKVGHSRKIFNVFAIFLVSGFWHGANWTFLFWGALNAIYFLPLLLLQNNRKNIGIVAKNTILPNLKELSSILTTFSLTCFAWIFFRSKNLSEAFNYIKGIFTNWNRPFWNIFEIENYTIYSLVLYLVFFISIEWVNRREQFGFQLRKTHWGVRFTLYMICFVLIIQHFGEEKDFIYFQF